MGILAADKITQGLDVDLWKINTDVEYQEEAKIKDVLIQQYKLIFQLLFEYSLLRISTKAIAKTMIITMIELASAVV